MLWVQDLTGLWAMVGGRFENSFCVTCGHMRAGAARAATNPMRGTRVKASHVVTTCLWAYG